LNVQYKKGTTRRRMGCFAPFFASSVQAEARCGFTKTEIQ
jgi:hypothetical protein